MVMMVVMVMRGRYGRGQGTPALFQDAGLRVLAWGGAVGPRHGVLWGEFGLGNACGNSAAVMLRECDT